MKHGKQSVIDFIGEWCCQDESEKGDHTECLPGNVHQYMNCWLTKLILNILTQNFLFCFININRNLTWNELSSCKMIHLFTLLAWHHTQYIRRLVRFTLLFTFGSGYIFSSSDNSIRILLSRVLSVSQLRKYNDSKYVTNMLQNPLKRSCIRSCQTGFTPTAPIGNRDVYCILMIVHGVLTSLLLI